jgi:segregation and condensation protein A
MHNYQVASDQYSGPLDILLQMIESQELDITSVSLAQVSDQYVLYINEHPEIPPEELADFLVIASKLLVIKSKALLPTLEIEEEYDDLEAQLKMYKQFVDASKKLQEKINEGHATFAKDTFPPHAIEGFVPPKKPLSIEKMHDLFELLLKKMEPVQVLKKKVIERVVTIREKITQIRESILRQATVSFNRVILETGSKSEKIVAFLAVLELAKQRIVDIDQDTFLGDIIVRKTDKAESIEVSTETEFLE